MFQLFGSLKGFIKPQSCITDNQVFRLHYRVTMTMLVAASLMMTGHQYFGDPIDCMTKRNVPPQLLDTYCWIHATYSIEHSWHRVVGVEVPYPGVDNSVQEQGVEPRVYHNYYQWVCFVLFFQAIGFYLPHYLWKCAEGGLVKNLILGLDKPIVKREDVHANVQMLGYYLQRSRGMHRRLIVSYVLAEVMNLVNVILQMVLMDRFLGGRFFSYGWEVMNFAEWAWPLQYDPMKRVFPRVAKCEFFQYGPTATVERFDTMCLLPSNILSEKVYIFLWFWFYFLAAVSTIVVWYRVTSLFVASLRSWSIQLRCRTLKRESIDRILATGNLGDWFLLHLLAINLNTLHFHELILHLNDRLESKKVYKDEDSSSSTGNSNNNLHHSD